MLLLHEVAFGAYLVAMLVSMLVKGGPAAPGVPMYALLIVAGAAVTVYCIRAPSDWRWRLRLFFYPVAMNLCFFQMKYSVPFLRSWRADELLRSVDHAILGVDLSLWIEPWVHPALTEVISACYLAFFPYLLASMIWYLVGDLALCRRFYAGLFTVYGIGFIGYACFPAAGPWVAMDGQFGVPLSGWVITRLNAAIVTAGSNGVDVFPSLHCAVPCFILFFDRWHKPWRFRCYAIPCAGLWLATIYLRYHYAVDLAAGFALAAAALYAVRPGRPARRSR